MHLETLHMHPASQIYALPSALQNKPEKGSYDWLSLGRQSGDGGSHAIWECPLCLAELTPDDFCELNACGHRACITCFQHYLRVEITESRVCISCPECLEPMHPNEALMTIE
ncbi:hypothetical protein HUJ04_011150 [Dendroctonus ponderosae]|nr:hypothetical protein HUJ04_011150 [Dendroctonus ponderosae]